MAKGHHEIELDLPIHSIWNFVSDINNWAPLVPGYQEHQIINKKESIWKLHGDLGKIERTVQVKILITEWTAPSVIHFELSNSSQTFVGNGFFKATSLTTKRTKMTGCLNVKIKGKLKPVINPILTTIVPKVGKNFTERVAKKLMERERSHATI